MEYSVFSYEEWYRELFLYEPHFKTTWLTHVFGDLEDVISWIKHDIKNKIIIVMPSQNKDRILLENKLMRYHDQCIALDSTDKYIENGSPFIKTEKLSDSIVEQIRKIIKKD